MSTASIGEEWATPKLGPSARTKERKMEIDRVDAYYSHKQAIALEHQEKRIAALKAQLAEAEKALYLYADRKNWKHSCEREYIDLWVPWDNGFDLASAYFKRKEEGNG
jgi:hypothetical protein